MPFHHFQWRRRLFNEKLFYECRPDASVARQLCSIVDRCCHQIQETRWWLLICMGVFPWGCVPSPASVAGRFNAVVTEVAEFDAMGNMVSNCRRISPLSFPIFFSLFLFTFVHALIWWGLRTCKAPLFFLGLCWGRVLCF